MMRYRSKAAILAAGVVLVLGLSACGQQSAARPDSVTLLHYFTGSLSSGIGELAGKVNGGKAGFLLEATPMEHESFKSAIRMQLEGPNPPDLFSYWAGAKTQSLVDRGRVLPLDGLFGAAVPKENFEPAVYQAMVYGGKPYMVPITRHYVGFFYNTRLFKEAGLEAPRTWDEFLAVCKAFKARGVTPLALGTVNRWPAQFWFDFLLLRTAGFDWRQDLLAGKHRFGDPAVRQAFTTWRALADAGWFNADAAAIDWDAAALKVAQGSCAMTLNGTWLIGTFTEKGFSHPADYSFFAFPTLGNTAEFSALGPIDGVLLSAGADHQEAAVKALAMMAGTEPQLAFSLAAGSIPAVAGVPSDRLQPLQRQIKGIIDASTHWAFNFDLATSPDRSEIGLDELLAFVKDPARLDGILADWDNRLDALAAK